MTATVAPTSTGPTSPMIRTYSITTTAAGTLPKPPSRRAWARSRSPFWAGAQTSSIMTMTAGSGTSYKQRLLLFRNLKGKFYEVGSSAGEALYMPRCARGSSVGDYDNDGDLDILLSSVDDAPGLLRNDGASRAGHWLTIKLIGDPARKCPRDAIGTTVFCSAGGRRMRGEVVSGQSFYSQSDLRVHFGLGAAAAVDKLEVRWANGKAEQFQLKVVDQFVVIEQGKGIVK